MLNIEQDDEGNQEVPSESYGQGFISLYSSGEPPSIHKQPTSTSSSASLASLTLSLPASPKHLTTADHN